MRAPRRSNRLHYMLLCTETGDRPSRDGCSCVGLLSTGVMTLSRIPCPRACAPNVSSVSLSKLAMETASCSGV